MRLSDKAAIFNPATFSPINHSNKIDGVDDFAVNV